jgi:hypothetical protein
MPKRRNRTWWEFSKADPPPAEFPTPDCFTDEEWATYYAAEQQAVWKNQKTLANSIQKDMCGDCTLAYQYSQVLVGKCNPQFGVITPVHRAAALISGEEETDES